MSRITDHAHHLVTDAHVVAADIDAALQALHDCRGGYPTSTPGAAPAEQSPPVEYEGFCAEFIRDEETGKNLNCGCPRPCPDHDTPVALTQTERDAGTLDRARLDHVALALALRRAAAHTAKARAIVDRNCSPFDSTRNGFSHPGADENPTELKALMASRIGTPSKESRRLRSWCQS